MLNTSDWKKIKESNQALATAIALRGYCVTSEDMDGLLAIDPNIRLLVICGLNRFICFAHQLREKMREVNADPNNYVRYVSLPCT